MKNEDPDIPQIWTPEHEAALQSESNGTRPAKRTSRAAIFSLLLGLLSMCLCGPVTAIPGLFCGLRGLSATATGRIKGRLAAWAGVLLSLLNIGLWTAVLLNAEWRSQMLLLFERARGRTSDVLHSGETALDANERNAINFLRRLRAAQEAHKVIHGGYARGCGSLTTEDPELGEAAGSSSRGVPFRGYFFKSLIRQGEGFVDHNKNFVIIAYPSEYGVSGRRTFAIKAAGNVLARDLGATPPKNAEELSRWLEAD